MREKLCIMRGRLHGSRLWRGGFAQGFAPASPGFSALVPLPIGDLTGQ